MRDKYMSFSNWQKKWGGGSLAVKLTLLELMQRKGSERCLCLTELC